MTETVKKPKPKRRRNTYFDGPKVTAALNAWHVEYTAAKNAGVPDNELPIMPDIVGSAILAVADNLAVNYRSAYDIQEMKLWGIELALKTIPNQYDPSKAQTKSCFSFITQLVKWGFFNYFTAEQKNLDRKIVFMEGMADGIVSIGNEHYEPTRVAAFKELREMVDEYKTEKEKDVNEVFDNI